MTLSDQQRQQQQPPPYVYPDQSDELPAYSNAIHLVTLCRRKREYTAPNVPARKGTRAWVFSWLVLSGTALNVYQPKRREVKAHTKREADTRAARLKEHKRAAKARKSDSASSELRSTASHAPHGLYAHPNESVASTLTFTRTPTRRSLPLPSLSVPKLPLDAAPSSSEPPLPLPVGGKLHRAHAAGPDARTHTLVRRYALNGATCTRAYDYLRRYFVLRIRADGEQFMVQLNSHPETLEWLAVSIILFGCWPVPAR